MKIKYLLLLSIVLLGSNSLFTYAQTQDKYGRTYSQDLYYEMPQGLVAGKDYIPNTIIIKFKPEAKQQTSSQSMYAQVFEEKLNAIGAKSQDLQQVFPQYNHQATLSQFSSEKHAGLVDISLIYELKYQGQMSIEDAINTLYDPEIIQYAEPSYIHHLQYEPNDPKYTDNTQFHLKQIKANDAWNITKGASSVIIAIVDSGVDYEHEDINANIHINSGEIANNNIDDDNDGYVDNYYGVDLVGADGNNPKTDGDPRPAGVASDHGTHVAGIAAAVGDNNKGGTGVAYQCKIMAVKVGSDNAQLSIYRGYEGIIYAANKGAQIINCSWGGGSNLSSQSEQDAITYATLTKNALVIVAAGNDNSKAVNIDPPVYQYAFSVASLTNTDAKSSFSNYGVLTDISAPGSSIYSTSYKTNQYVTLSGTSMAAPVVAGCAALVKTQFPSYNAIQIGELLRVTADNIDTQNGGFVGQLGGGRVNIHKALTQAPSPSVRMETRTVTESSNTLSINAKFINYLTATTAPVTIEITTTDTSLVAVNNSYTSPAALATLGSYTPANFTFTMKNSLPRHAIVTFKIKYTAGAYTAEEYFVVKLKASTHLTVEKNKIKTTLTSYGRVGFDDDFSLQGNGFIYKNQSLLYSMGLLIGNSNTKISNTVLASSTEYNHDHFVPTSNIQALTTASKGADFQYSTVFTDNNNAQKLGLSITQNTYVWTKFPNDRFIIIEFAIRNTTASTLSNLYAGLFADWDITENNQNVNQTGWDAATKTGYISSADASSAAPFAGIQLLTDDTPNYYGIDNSATNVGAPWGLSDGFTMAEKWQSLSSGIGRERAPAGTTGRDVSHLVSAGPFTIAAGQTKTIAFAIIAADNLNDLKAQASYTKSAYAGQAVSISNLDDLEENKSVSIYPNPTSEFVTVQSAKKITQIQLTTLQGQNITTLLRNAQDNHIEIALGHLAEGVYILQLLLEDGNTIQEKLIIKK